MLLCDISRERLISLLPPGGEVAEIGVAEGAFSAEILRQSDPKRLHLIDPWEHQIRPDYKDDLYGNVSGQEQDTRYRAVLGMFDSEIRADRVAIHRGYSVDVGASFESEQFDWIYVDALHSREAVAADLRAYQHKVKPEGFILGHDYTNHFPARQAGFGVVEAVNAFVIEEGFSLLAVTMENFPTYVMSRAPRGAPAEQFCLKILSNASRVVELRNFPLEGRYEHHAVSIGGKTVVYSSF